ncbi:MAG TPA: hypothetical protein PKX27_00050 [Bacteroidales bacterium]|jgi:hypothetical protein|nr:hypothetical protein [Bacteroidales bacterium]HOX74505.1 hypothetical protein [Bacteroidales bacterium]HPM86340.1 hypothetical protein [Bacteroidales bacterium]HQM69891.1 hypothetical protein [Bacteroidales bacterium]
MKNLKFIAGTFLGILIGMFLFIIISFKPEPTVSLPQSSNKITSLNSKTEVYRLNVDNNQYIVVVNTGGGTAIVKHR